MRKMQVIIELKRVLKVGAAEVRAERVNRAANLKVI